jgi:hypothetical protein
VSADPCIVLGTSQQILSQKVEQSQLIRHRERHILDPQIGVVYGLFLLMALVDDQSPEYQNLVNFEAPY